MRFARTLWHGHLAREDTGWKPVPRLWLRPKAALGAYHLTMNDEPLKEEQFISEPVSPVPGTYDLGAMGRGEPGLPARFLWRDREYEVVSVLKAWKTSSPEGGTGRLYLRRHWYTVKTRTGERMTLYCERQTRNRKHPTSRWWLFSMRSRS